MANKSLKSAKSKKTQEHDALALAQLIYDIWIEKKVYSKKKKSKT